MSTDSPKSLGALASARVRWRAREWLSATVLLLGLGLAAAVTSTFAATAKPNILVILSDDAGYADFGFQGGGNNGDYADLTPNLDSLVTNGTRFRNGYATAPICCPSRAGLLTGRYQQCFGFENNVSSFPQAG